MSHRAVLALGARQELRFGPRSTLLINHRPRGASKIVGSLIHRLRRGYLALLFGAFHLLHLSPALGCSTCTRRSFRFAPRLGASAARGGTQSFSRNLSQSGVTNSIPKRPYTGRCARQKNTVTLLGDESGTTSWNACLLRLRL